MLHEALEITHRELDLGRPEDPLAGVLRGPKLQALNDCSLDGDGPAVFAGTEAEIRGGQPVELFFDGLDGAPATSRPRVRFTKAVRLSSSSMLGDCVRRASAFRW